jgi:hypothetical protein
MNFMVKDDFPVFDLAFEEALVMTSVPEAAFIGNLCPGLGLQIELGPVAADLHQALDLGPEFRPDPRRIVAGAAGDLGVRGALPASVKGFHIVAGGAEA